MSIYSYNSPDLGKNKPFLALMEKSRCRNLMTKPRAFHGTARHFATTDK